MDTMWIGTPAGSAFPKLEGIFELTRQSLTEVSLSHGGSFAATWISCAKTSMIRFPSKKRHHAAAPDC